MRIEYRTRLFEPASILEFFERYLRLLSAIADTPQAPLWRLTPGGTVIFSHVAAERPSTKPAATVPVFPRGRRISSPARPADRIEETLADLWAKALGTRPPGREADFFDIGGHSLMAVRLVAAINKAFGTALPVAMLFVEPTIAGMARWIRGDGDMSSSVTPISATGWKRPLFAAGSSREYRDLSRALAPDRPFFQMDVYGLQEKRALAGEPPYRTVPEIAGHFLKDMLLVQPTGPYFVGGQCEGGIIALEIALQLQERGHEVALLAEFDTPVNGYFRKHHWLRRGLWLLFAGQLPARIRTRMRFIGDRFLPVDPDEQRYRGVWQEIWNAIAAYQPARLFEGEIQLFRAQETYGVYEDVAVGWEARASRGVRIHEAPGNHFQFFQNPESQDLIKRVIELSDVA
jgi:thioesterase domain-containing protein/acyl carrier protein